MIKLNHSPIHSDPDILGGTLIFRGTRVPAQTLLSYLNDGISLQKLHVTHLWYGGFSPEGG